MSDERREFLADAAGLITAAIDGDDGAVDTLLVALADAGDFRGALRLLRCTVTVAAVALRAEAVRVAEAGEDSSPALDALVSLAGAARDE